MPCVKSVEFILDIEHSCEHGGYASPQGVRQARGLNPLAPLP